MAKYPHAARLIADWLKTRMAPDVNNFATQLPYNLTFVMPLVVVERIGGPDRILGVDEPTLDIDVFQPNQDAAIDLGEDVRQLVRLHLPGQILPGGVAVKSVGTNSGPAPAPWDNTQIRRISATYQIKLHRPL